MKTIIILLLFSLTKFNLIAQESPLLGINPFIVEKLNITLPDSLGGNNLKGSFALLLNVDSLGIIHSFRLSRIKIKKDSCTSILDYRYGEKENAMVEKYKKWLGYYITKIKIKRNPEFPKSRLPAKLVLPVKIKINDN